MRLAYQQNNHEYSSGLTHLLRTEAPLSFPWASGDPSYLLPSHHLQNTEALGGRSSLCFGEGTSICLPGLESPGLVGMVTLLGLECESLGGRDLTRKRVGVGDKRLVGVAGFNPAAWNVGEREAVPEAWSSLPHNQEDTR